VSEREQQPIRAAVMTMSDQGAQGKREDTSGDRIVEFVARLGAELVERTMIPDDRDLIRSNLMRFADDLRVDLVLTTGGTGIAPRDNTPDATASVVDYQVPGIAEAMRAMSVQKTPFGMLSRQVVGVRRGTLILNLPGSPKAVSECLEVIEPVLQHAVELIRGGATDHTPPPPPPSALSDPTRGGLQWPLPLRGKAMAPSLAGEGWDEG
jgi:molybdenum cofactor synthesis domain-containing protein